MKAGLPLIVALTLSRAVGMLPVTGSKSPPPQMRVVCERLLPLISTHVFCEIVAASPVAFRIWVDAGVLSGKLKAAAILGPKTEASGCCGTWENPVAALANNSAAVIKADFMVLPLAKFSAAAAGL